ncbi:MFS transporter [Luteipulveratus mongoliensis]|uniref:MFS transporter n=1 Tax=Luteipulveratus mongoliensis TaxID=571913 RepID=A0A0K1JP76_9MICO|nr:MFS transporter [Luteipulveratus mongoliensis]
MRRSSRDAFRLQGRSALVRWLISFGTFGIPQAATPIAFALLTLPLTGRAEDGATMVLAMTLAQVVGAIPVSRPGRRFNAVTYLRWLIAVRTIALGLVALLAALGAPLGFLIGSAAIGGVVNGAAYGYQRSILNHLVRPSSLPRALGIAATLNEVVFAVAPVLAAVLGSLSPTLAMFAIVVLGALPLVLVPSVPDAKSSAPAGSGMSLLTPPVLMWLLCAAASSAAVASVEISAVALALSFDLDPTWAFVFTGAVCVASVSGGVCVSVRNRRSRPTEVVCFLAATMVGAVLVSSRWDLAPTLLGAVLIGFFLPLLGTHYSLVLDDLAPDGRRAEIFALLRTSTAVGIIVVSGLLATAGLRGASLGSAALMVMSTCIVAAAVLRRAGVLGRESR